MTIEKATGVRNPEATCATCPYLAERVAPVEPEMDGWCRIEDPSRWRQVAGDWWCGRHPRIHPLMVIDAKRLQPGRIADIVVED